VSCAEIRLSAVRFDVFSMEARPVLRYAGYPIEPRRIDRMGLVQRCRHNFAHGVIYRGEDYFRSKHVVIKDVVEGTVAAEVQGTDRQPYSVYIDWQQAAEDDTVLFFCSCPFAMGGSCCKHLYAVLLALDARGVGMSIPGRAPLDLVPDEALDEDSYLEEIAWSQGEPADRRPPSPATSPATPPVVSWTHPLQAIRASLTSPADLDIHPSAVEGEVWYLLDNRELVRTGRLTLLFHTRKRKVDGTLGAFRQLSVDRERGAAFPDPADRQIFLELLGADLDERRAGWSSWSGGGRQTISQATPRFVQYDSLLPRLCLTGRFAVIEHADALHSSSAPLRWDGNSPWRFQLRIERAADGSSWNLSGEMVRENERCALNEPWVIWKHGMFAKELAFHRVENPSAYPWIVALREQGTIKVPVSESEALLEAVWNMPQLPPIDWPEELRREARRGTPRPVVQIRSLGQSRRGDSLEAMVTLDYDGHRIDPGQSDRMIVESSDGTLLLRDPDKELELRRRILSLGLQPSLYYDRHSWVFELRSNILPRVVRSLVSMGCSVEADGKRFRPAGPVSLRVSSGVDWFDLHGQVEFGDTSVPFPDILRALKNGLTSITLGDGSEGMLPEDWLRRFGPLADLGVAVDGNLRFGHAQTALLDALLASEERLTVDASFEQLRSRLRGFEGVQPSDPPRGFRGVLRPYQKLGLGWLQFLREFGFGGCLADDMGLGKTIQVLALLQERRSERSSGKSSGFSLSEPRPSLVVAPRSVVHNWCDEAQRFTPRLRVLDYTGLGRAALRKQFDSHDIVVTTYGTLRRDILHLREILFHYAILDEAQNIKNAASQAAKAARLLKARHRLALTGTPVENHLGELWSLFEFLNPRMLGSSSWMRPLAGKSKGSDEDAARLLGRALRPFCLRRTKEKVLPELPKKTEQTLICEMEGSQKKLYNELKEHYRMHLSKRIESMGLARSKIHVLEALLRLRQAACHPALIDPARRGEKAAKLEALEEQLLEIRAEGHKALIFSQFTSFLSLVRERLIHRGLVFEYLDGSTCDRSERIRRFQEDPECGLFLISLKAGGAGLNLTAADYVFILDPWWNPAVEAQAVDRTHRIGQTRPVFAYRLICRDTVEEKILELQKEKRVLADAILTEDHSVIRNLTEEDLELLLG
jgi:superfamily II DNA or RNA helicase